MTLNSLQKSQLAAAFVAVSIIAGASGYYLAGSQTSASSVGTLGFSCWKTWATRAPPSTL